MDMYVTDWGLTRDEVNQIASDSEKLMDLLVNESAVVLLHDERNNIRASVPGLLLASKYYPKRSDGERLSIVRENSIFFAIGTKQNYDDALGKLKSERKGSLHIRVSHMVNGLLKLSLSVRIRLLWLL